jgi:predicted negative regulator of RcsB-dependent stress response
MVGSNIGELLVSQRRYNDAETVLVEAVRVLRSHHLADAVFAESQLARLRLNKGEVDQAISMLQRLREEAIAVKEHQSQVEAALYLCQGYLKLGEPDTALATLEDAERVAGDDAELFGCAIARIRGQALVALGRTDEARRVWDKGIALAKDQQMLFEEAQLLLLAASLEESAPQSQELAEKAGALLRQLGVVQSVSSI